MINSAMQAIIIILVVLLLLFGGRSDGAEQMLGKRTLKGEVVLVTDEYDAWNCRNQSNPEHRKGVHIARVTGKNMFVLYCGTDINTGDKVTLTLEEGI